MPVVTVSRVREVFLAEFKASAAAFAKSSHALQWIALKRAMLHHQQAQQLREFRPDHVEFAAKLGANPMGEWGKRLVEFQWPNTPYEELVAEDK